MGLSLASKVRSVTHGYRRLVKPSSSAESKPAVLSSAAISHADRVVLTTGDSPPAELERVCGPVVTDALKAGLESASSASKFPCSESNTAVKDLIRRFVNSDNAGERRAVTFQEAVGAIVSENMCSGSAAI